MARPQAEIDGDLVLKLAQLGCKTKEIADHFGVSENTITNRFLEELTKGRADVRMSLRQWQLAAAKKGNVVMQIWLGKQMLGQVDKQEIKQEITTNDSEKVKEMADWLRRVKEIT